MVSPGSTAPLGRLNRVLITASTFCGFLAGIVTPGSTTTYKVSVACNFVSNATDAYIKAAVTENSPGSYASYLIGVKIK